MVVVLLALTVAVYANSLRGKFVFDDHPVTIKSPTTVFRQKRLAGHGPHGERGLAYQRRVWYQHRRLLWMTYERDAAVHGMDNPIGWHVTNLGIHAVNAVLVYALLIRFFEPAGALMGGAVFAVHPLGTSSVSSIAGRSSALCGTFYFGALIAVLLQQWWLVPILAYLGFKSKEEIAALPFAAMATLWLAR